MSITLDLKNIQKKYIDLENDWKRDVKKIEELTYNNRVIKETYENTIKDLEDKLSNIEEENKFFRNENQLYSNKLNCFCNKEKLISDLMKNDKCQIVEEGLERTMFEYVIEKIITYLINIQDITMEECDI